MPTYKFYCDQCKLAWSEAQEIDQVHVVKCSKCNTECKNLAFGGTGFQFAGRLLNNQLRGFPDYAHKINTEADKDAEQMEKDYDQYVKEERNKDKE